MSVNGTTRETFRARRKRMMEAIAPGATAILPSAPVSVRSGDVEFVYRQDSDFYYLTGFAEPESVALLSPGHPDGEFVMFVRPRDKERETWTGRRAGIEGAIIEYGADKAYVIDELEKILPRYLEKSERVHYPLGLNEKMDERVMKLIRWAQSMRPRIGVGPVGDRRSARHHSRGAAEEGAGGARCDAARDGDFGRRAQARDVEGARRDAGMADRGGGRLRISLARRGRPELSIDHRVGTQRRDAALHQQRSRDAHRRAAADRRGRRVRFLRGRYHAHLADWRALHRLAAQLYEIVLDAQLKAIDAIKPGAHFDDAHEVALRVLVDGMRSSECCGAPPTR